MGVIKIERCNGVCTLTLNRPDQLNAFSPELLDGLRDAIKDAETDPETRALVITGEGRAFSAGADLKYLLEETSGDFTAALMPFLRRFGALFETIEASPLPVIAAVNGLAMAGGFELLLCCDIVIASESAVISDAHATYGLLPGAGGTARLTKRIGLGRAKLMMMTAARLSAIEAERWGLVEKVVPDTTLIVEAQNIAASLAEKSPLGLAHIKEMLNGADDRLLHDALEHELSVSEGYSSSQDLREGLRAFSEKRKPVFTGQ